MFSYITMLPRDSNNAAIQWQRRVQGIISSLGQLSSQCWIGEHQRGSELQEAPWLGFPSPSWSLGVLRVIFTVLFSAGMHSFYFIIQMKGKSQSGCTQRCFMILWTSFGGTRCQTPVSVITAARVTPTGEAIDTKRMRWIIRHHCK